MASVLGCEEHYTLLMPTALLPRVPVAFVVQRPRRGLTNSLNQNTRHRIHHPIDVGVGGAPVSYANAHGAAATPGRAAKERFAGLEYRGNYFVGAAIVIVIGCAGFSCQK